MAKELFMLNLEKWCQERKKNTRTRIWLISQFQKEKKGKYYIELVLGFKADASKAQEGWLVVGKQSERYVFSVTKSDCMESQGSALKVKKKKKVYWSKCK